MINGYHNRSTGESDSLLTNISPAVVGLARAGGPTIKQIAEIYSKDSASRNQQEIETLETFAHMIPSAEGYLKTKQEKEKRLLEVEESHESIQAKTEILANLIRESRHTVIYTGAGISTSASIPDYRGPNGIWTQIKKTGSFSITKVLDLSNAEPTFTHMAIKELARRRIVKHVVSQNCDGLHLRSGIAQNNLSEIHGNMYIEVCPTCERQYFREADVTQRTCRFRHKTGRRCHTCLEPDNNLIDTIVLYGERSRTKWPMNWERASKAADQADLIICMGSSLKTLRRYGCLWPANYSSKKSKSPETKLVIINLQHTSKDKNAFMKINGKCDTVMASVMRRLKIEVTPYKWLNDPLVRLAVPFTIDELAKLKRNLIFDSHRYQASSLDRSATPETQDDDDDDEEECESASQASPSSISRAYSEAKRSRPSDEDDNRISPSLFVSELTDDPIKKRLRMRIRAVNVGAAGSNELATDVASFSNNGVKQEMDLVVPKSENSIVDMLNPNVVDVKRELIEQNSENLILQNPMRRVVEYSPPGWLGKGIGVSKSSVYRRKRHGNKGRKRAPAAVIATDSPMHEVSEESLAATALSPTSAATTPNHTTVAQSA